MVTQTPARPNKRMVLIIGLMVAMWAAVVIGRHQIRARWWEHKLAAETQLEEKARYLALLVSLGDRSLPSAERLLRHRESAMRSYGLVILEQLDFEAVVALLEGAAADSDPEIRREAIRALGRRYQLQPLQKLIAQEDASTASAAAEGLSLIGSEGAIRVLLDNLARHASSSVRAQIIETLGDLENTQAIDALTTCLADDSIVGTPTAGERSARGAAAVLFPAQKIDWPKDKRVADYAREALARITAATHASSQPAEVQ